MSSSVRSTRSARAVLGASVLALTLLGTSACGPDNSSADTAAAAGAPALGLPANLDDLKKWKFEDWEKWAKDYALPAATKGFWTLEKLLQAKPNEPIEPPAPQPAGTQAPAQPSAPGPSTPAAGSKPPAGQPTQPGHPTTPAAATTPAAPKPSNTQQPASQAPAPPKQPAQQPSQAPAQPTQAPAQPSQPAQPPAQPGQPPAQPPAQPADNGNDPLPKTVNAQPLQHPYTKLAVHGKLFADEPGAGAAGGGLGRSQCSATVVADPAHPGKSNLVWTAGHCVHQGKGGSFYSNISFIPAFNSNAAMSGGKQADESQYAPFGIWGATQAVTSPQWKAEGGKTGDAATHYDFAVIRVKPADGAKSLEETVGGAVPVWFNAPRDQLSVTEYGYPAAPPFDGMELNRCESGKPGRLSYEPTRPPMLVIGCTMTGGSSGGGWLAVKDGKPALVSNVSVGKHTGDPMYQAGPYLDDVAAGAYDFLSKKG
ncbi:hypothetical protein [Kitasatospora sp. NPDC005751]|uniref:trypsin-like serine peptidase n=1 Tax=Kitasatospora sp. NPDC005751 TaxID=3157064 RepID=UPI0033F4D5BD